MDTTIARPMNKNEAI